MDKFHVRGSTKLQGEITTPGAENAALPILSAALLVEGPIEIQNVPKLKNVDTSMKLLSQLGAKVERNGSAHIDACGMDVFCAPYDLMKTMHTSIWALGPLVARFGQGQVSLPGDCAIGARPIDLHITGLEQLGATVKLEEGCVKVPVDGRLRGMHIVMDEVSVGTTVTIMCVVTLAEGATIIENVAREPETVDTANFLIVPGAKTVGRGTDRITIKGAERLGGGVYRALPDCIETDTSLVATTISRGKIIYRNAQSDMLDAVLAKLCDTGTDIKAGDDWISLDIHGKRPKAINVRVAPHPAFPTDMQTQFMLLSLVAGGADLVTETVSENHFMHMPELNRIGAHAEIESNAVICHGVETLSGAQVMATDLHASASLVLVGCIVEGTTAIDRIYHIDRDYERIEDRLHTLGVNTERVKDE